MAGGQWAWGGVFLGSGPPRIGITEQQQLWFVVQCEKDSDGAVSMTWLGSLWVFGKHQVQPWDVAPGPP